MVSARFGNIAFFGQVVLDRVDQGGQRAGCGLPLPAWPVGYQPTELGRQVGLEGADDRLAVGAELEHRDAAVAGVGDPVGQAAGLQVAGEAFNVGAAGLEQAQVVLVAPADLLAQVQLVGCAGQAAVASQESG